MSPNAHAVNGSSDHHPAHTPSGTMSESCNGLQNMSLSTTNSSLNTSADMNGIERMPDDSPLGPTTPEQRERDTVRPDHHSHMQRTRRSSRNIDESSRRRSSRTTRHAGHGPASGAGVALRPTLDLPHGYGTIICIEFQPKY